MGVRKRERGKEREKERWRERRLREKERGKERVRERETHKAGGYLKADQLYFPIDTCHVPHT